MDKFQPSVRKIVNIAFTYKQEELEKDIIFFVCKGCGRSTKFANKKETTNCNLISHLKGAHTSHKVLLEEYFGPDHQSNKSMKRKPIDPVSAMGDIIVEGEAPSTPHRQTKTLILSSMAASTPTSTQIPAPFKFTNSQLCNNLFLFSKSAVDDAICRLLVGQSLPFSLVESAEFKYLLECLNNKYKPPTARTIKRSMIPKMKRDVQDKVHLMFDKCDSINISLDIWTDSTRRAYIAFNADAISTEWEKIAATLGVIRITGTKIFVYNTI